MWNGEMEAQRGTLKLRVHVLLRNLLRWVVVLATEMMTVMVVVV
jgi:hypothetical protein